MVVKKAKIRTIKKINNLITSTKVIAKRDQKNES